jgi:hypothetical protein
MKTRTSRTRLLRFRGSPGVAMAMVVISLTLLATLGVGLLAVGYGARRQAVSVKADLAAMLAAEAGYEQAVFWMCQQSDMLSALQQGATGTTGSLSFPDSSCTYQISLFSFSGSRPVFRILSQGYSGVGRRTVDVYVVQAVSGWDMGYCRMPSSATTTTAINFLTGDTVDMPMSVNNANDSPDSRDLNISGTPSFQQAVSMGESRYTSSGVDKYGSIMSLFSGGIYFDQPATKITDETSVQQKINRFQSSTLAAYRFTPTATSSVTSGQPAVQLEFFVENGVGKVTITNNCTVRGFQQTSDSRTYDFKIAPGTGGTQYQRYYLYSYHVAPKTADASGARITVPITNTYVTQAFNGVQSDPGGQIFVTGNVVIGGNNTANNNDQLVKGKITVVATGNIWVADSIYVDGAHDSAGLPTSDNPNVLGLLAQGVIKVVDPGLSTVDSTMGGGSSFVYAPVGRPNNPTAKSTDSNYNVRYLPDPTVIEAALTIGGGGWGAENVARGSYGGRKQASGTTDYLHLHGSIAEAIRGIICVADTDGYLKSYHMDERLLAGIVPGDIGLRGKYVPAPAGWHDYRPSQ